MVNIFLTLLCFAFMLSGCASSHSGSVYSDQQAQREQVVRLGVVESVRRVTIEGGRGEVGAASGAVVGGVAGSNVGSGKGTVVGSILGAVVGGIAGSAIERNVTKKEGLEITVKLDNGELRAVTQEADEQFHPGERVRLLSSGHSARITH